jgi:hypothetical protein
MPTVPTDRFEAVLHGAKGVAETAVERGQELLETDAAQELMRRAGAVVAAAKGIENIHVSTHKTRRWPFGLLMLGTGAAIGAAAAIVSKRMSTPVPEPLLEDSRDYPVKGGTVDLTHIDDPAAELTGASANGQPQTERKNP